MKFEDMCSSHDQQSNQTYTLLRLDDFQQLENLYFYRDTKNYRMIFPSLKLDPFHNSYKNYEHPEYRLGRSHLTCVGRDKIKHLSLWDKTPEEVKNWIETCCEELMDVSYLKVVSNSFLILLFSMIERNYNNFMRINVK